MIVCTKRYAVKVFYAVANEAVGKPGISNIQCGNSRFFETDRYRFGIVKTGLAFISHSV